MVALPKQTNKPERRRAPETTKNTFTTARGAEFSAHDIAHLFAPDRTNHSSEATPTTDTPTIHLLPADRRAFAISDDSRSGTLWAKPGEW